MKKTMYQLRFLGICIYKISKYQSRELSENGEVEHPFIYSCQFEIYNKI